MDSKLKKVIEIIAENHHVEPAFASPHPVLVCTISEVFDDLSEEFDLNKHEVGEIAEPIINDGKEA